MPRAYTPQDSLEPLPLTEPGNSIPVEARPKFTIGQIVELTPLQFGQDRFYYLKLLIKEHGHSSREILNLLKNATEISVAAVEPFYALPTIMICNQCYLVNGQCHSGLTWRYRLLIKGEVNGNKVCIIPRVWLDERRLK